MNMARFFLILLAAAVLGLDREVLAAAEADLLVAYDQSHANSVGGEDNARVLALNAVAGSNLINERSGTPARVRICGYHQAAQNLYQTTSKGGFVNWMANYDSHMTDVVDAGNARGADLVAWICVSTSDGAAAVAQQPGRYSAFDPGSFWAVVVAHELGGHNYGCDHRGGRENPKTVMMHNYCGGGAAPPYFYSNPNIWLNGVKLLGEGSCLGAATDGGDNAYLISNTAQGVADRYERITVAPNLASVVRRWKFNQAAGTAAPGTTVVDQVTGTALATVQGNGATFTGGGVRLPGGAAGSGSAYVQLPAGVLSGYANATVEIWAKPLSAQNWARIMDFNNGTADYIMLTSSIGTDLSSQRFSSASGGTYVDLDSGLPTTAGVLHHYAIRYTSTGASTGRWQWYRDGEVVAYLDVGYALSALKDINNWLGRSPYAGDALGNCEYAEVRISNVSLSSDQIMANAQLGPNYTPANVMLTGNDPYGGTSSFTTAGTWSDGAAPGGGKSYETMNWRLITPGFTGSPFTFGGSSLKLSGGSLVFGGNAGSGSATITVNNLTFQGSELLHAGVGTCNLAGSLAIGSEGATVRAAAGKFNLSSSMSGSGTVLYLNNSVTLSGSNTAFTGKTIVGDGRFSSIVIDSEARLGANPPNFTADQLTLNRGVLFTNGSFTIDDANRGIRIGASAGIFNVGAGTTLTIAVPIAGTTSGDALVTAPIFPNPVSGLFIKENTGTLILTNPNNSHVGEIVIGAGELRLDGAGRLNNGDTPMAVTVSGTLNVNTTGDQAFGGVISGGGIVVKGNSGTMRLYSANTFTGGVTVNGGTLYANAANAANNRNFSYAGSITVNNGGTLRTSANALFGWDGTQEKPITVNPGGTLTADSNADVGLGALTLAGGTLANLGASTTWGSWRFDDATDKLRVTENSIVSAMNVKFGNASAAIEVAAGKTLNFTGTITNATSGGTSYLTKTGTGTLVLTNTNTYGGATAINAGTLKLNGSLAAASAVTVDTGATMMGTGTVNGSLTFAANSVHAPGDAIGTQTVVGPLSYANTARLKWALNSNSDASGSASRVTAGAVNVTSGAAIDLTLNAGGSTANYFDAFWTQPRSWTVVSSSAMAGAFTLGTVSADSGAHPASSYGAFSLTQNAAGVTLNWTPKPFAVWRGTQFGVNAGAAGTSDFLSNPDQDSLANAFEYFYDTNPAAPTVTPLIAQIVTNRATLTFPHNTAASDVLARVQGADSLTGPWTDLAESAAGANFAPLADGVTVSNNGEGSTRTVTFTDLYLISDPGHSQRFFRIWIQQDN